MHAFNTHRSFLDLSQPHIPGVTGGCRRSRRLRLLHPARQSSVFEASGPPTPPPPPQPARDGLALRQHVPKHHIAADCSRSATTTNPCWLSKPAQAKDCAKRFVFLDSEVI